MLDRGGKKRKKGRVGVGSVDGGNAAVAGSASTVLLHSLAMLLAKRGDDRGRGGDEGGGGDEKY